MSALRRLADALEAAQVAQARRQGWSWQEIADALGVTKQAVHQKHGRPGERSGRPMMERFTTDGPRRRARRRGRIAGVSAPTSVAPTHLLLALAQDRSGIGGVVLRGAGIDPEVVSSRLQPTATELLDADDAAALQALGIDAELVLGRMRESFGADAVRRPARRRGRTRVSAGVKKSLQLGLREAVRLGSARIGTEHLLLGLLRCDDPEVRRSSSPPAWSPTSCAPRCCRAWAGRREPSSTPGHKPPEARVGAAGQASTPRGPDRGREP